MSAVSYRSLFAGRIELSVKTAAQLMAAYPASAAAFARLGKALTTAQSRRARHAEEGVEVPPLLIVSTTDACNLACAGCYACARGGRQEGELPETRVAEILDEAAELGVGVVFLAGGEPLLSRGWLEALGRHGDLAGVVFTNGTLFDAARRDWFAAHRHILPAFSLEGGAAHTDERRGSGVYARVNEAMRGLHDARIPFGVSLTVTSRNIDALLREEFTEEYIKKGCRLFFYVEYVPVEAGQEPMALSAAEKKRLSDFAEDSAGNYPALFIPFPGDEDAYGGCLAAGRGFVHVSARGDVEPCPFAPFSDVNLKDVSLKEALASRFLSKVRENHAMLKEGAGGCALWRNREWLETLL